jgi:hypothetical protein
VPLGRLREKGVLQPDALKRIDRAAMRDVEIAVSVEPNESPPAQPSAPFIYRGKFE